jgi:ATP-binding protein involved in chromosome partitioning
MQPFFIEKMTKDQVLELLKTIKYPGFNRDIVSFGMIKDIITNEDQVEIKLNISSQNDEKKKKIVQAIETLLSPKVNKLNINLSNDQSPPAQIQTPNTPIGLNNVKNIIAVASGKGGVGKSTVAVNLATALVKKGRKVGLLDLDIYGPSLPIALNLFEQPKMTQNKKLIPLEKFGMQVMSFGFISGNDTPVIWRGPLVSRMTEQFFMDVEWGDLDVMILDLPPGTGDIQLTLTQKMKMTGAIIVTTPQDIALSDVRKGADMFKKVNTPVLGVIENMSGLMLSGKTNNINSKIEISGENLEIDKSGNFSLNIDIFKKDGGKKESERLGVPLLCKIPLSKEIMVATDSGTPLVIAEPSNPLSNIYMNLAEQVSQIISL